MFMDKYTGAVMNEISRAGATRMMLLTRANQCWYAAEIPRCHARRVSRQTVWTAQVRTLQLIT